MTYIGRATNLKITIQYTVEEEWWKDGESHIYERCEENTFNLFPAASVYFNGEITEGED